MAIIAIRAGGDVRRILADRGNAVVTGPAGAEHLGMVDSEGRRKDIGRVTVFADVTGLHMGNILADRLNAVMAVDTIASDVYMVEVGR